FSGGMEWRPDAISDSRILLLENHFTKVVNSGTDVYGALKSPMWMSSLDPATGSYPENDERPEQIPQRVYLDRSVSAPKGVTLYWDFPNIAAAYELSLHTKSELYKNAAKDYVTSYLSKCQSKNGIFLWGNHYYYDAFTDQCVKFKSDEKARPVDFTTERGELHEMRPHAPPWKILWNIDSIATERHITATISGHLVDMETGEFNRHADGERGYAFLEYGGILVYTLSWLYEKTKDENLLKKADRIIQFSIDHKNDQTGLVENSPTQDRWDKYTSTTEVGLWGNYILKAAELAPEYYKADWRSSVDKVVSAWLAHGFHEEAKQYYGGLLVADGLPFSPDPDYPYQPGVYAEVWNPLFPTHNYPLQLAETCLKLYQITAKELYREACERWIGHIKIQTENRHKNTLLYAENYARILHYLMHYKELNGSQEVTVLIDKLVRESIDTLYLEKYGMFRSHT
ncbi:MAG: hypothetical protein KAK04_08885, partial [Cyclobacteriaceae bacterium]|nr:hypothetical protein [Cyclobacteriaceae bacterium]